MILNSVVDEFFRNKDLKMKNISTFVIENLKNTKNLF